MKYAIILSIVVFTGAVHAHGNTEISIWDKLGIPDPAAIVMLSAAVAAFFLVMSLYYKDMGKQAKKIAFLCIIVPVGFGTVYLGTSTIYLNMKSVTGGPVHWHADYEVWACGNEYELMDPEGIENRVGTEAVHEHNDKRMHIEGVLMEIEEASLGEYFEKVGGSFTESSLSIPTDERMMSWSNGELCNGTPASWYVFVNGELEKRGPEHIIAPYPDVPPGDRIKFVFSEKSPDQINTDLFEVP